MARAYAEIDMAAITHNTRILGERAGGSSVCAVVKANGYGHGAETAARAALAGGATRLGVAQVAEGVALRDLGFGEPVWLFSEPEPSEFATCGRFHLEPPVYSERGWEAAVATGAKSPLHVHVMVDTGMHRVGCSVESAAHWAQRLDSSPGLSLRSVWTHLAVADEPDHPYTGHQLDRFDEALDSIADAGVELPLVHAANSAGTIAVPRSHFHVVRPGVALYGMAPSPALAGMADLRPAMKLWSTVSLVKRLRAGDRVSYGLRTELRKDANIATLPIGYADGARRGWWEHGEVLIHGERCKIVGVITMDQMLVDCGDLPVGPGDEAVLIGAQANENISADEWAKALGTINYEITCGIGARVERIVRQP
ncbi:MAG: alanine racemase [Acidimicrobiales bacterium]|nr:alanine racemase [Acidimicrobiales bacterium]